MSQQENITTKDGKVTVTIIQDSDLSIDRITEYLLKNSFAADYSKRADSTQIIPKEIKTMLIKDVEKR